MWFADEYLNIIDILFIMKEGSIAKREKHYDLNKSFNVYSASINFIKVWFKINHVVIILKTANLHLYVIY